MDRFWDAVELTEILGDWAVGRGPLYRKLARALAAAIHDHDLLPGERLTPERQLAKALAVSRATVVGAYDELRALGIVDSRQGSGTRVARSVGTRQIADGRVPGGGATSIFQRLVEGPGAVISLAYAVEPGVPELGEALLNLVEQDLPHLLTDVGYHPRGLPVLRQRIAAGFGAPTTPEQVVVTTGATQAIGLVAQLYLHRGSTVVVESPSWPGCLDILRAVGARLVGVPLDEEGIAADGVARACTEHRPDLLYVMPTYHNPTGTLMSAVRRRRIAEIATRHGVPILEDNAYTTVPGTVPPPIARHDAAEVLSVGSLAKAVWGGLRVGWVRAPAPIAERLARLKALADLGSPVLDQALAARLLPGLAQLTAARATALRSRRDHLAEMLTARLPDWRWHTPDGGSALWIKLPDIDARVFAQVALRHGVEVVPGATMDPSGAYDSYIRLPFTFPDDVLTELVHRLCRAWTELQRHGSPTAGDLHPIV
jgi:DNA-binding transcriptional MocR family regulator